MVKGPGTPVTSEHGETQKNLSSKRPSTVWHSEINTMDSFQDGGQIHMNSEHGDYSAGGMEGSYMNPEMNSYGPSPGDPVMGSESFGRMDGMHPGQMPHYGYNRQGFGGSGDNNSMAGSDFNSSHNMNFGQYPQNPGSRAGYPGVPQPSMGPGRPGMGSHGMGMMPGVPGPYNPNQRMMSGQSITQQSGPTPTLNQLLQTPNSQPRYPDSSYDGYPGPQKGDMVNANGPYGMQHPQGWMQNQRGGMGNFQPMSMSGSASYRGQVPQNYNQQGYNQPMPPNSQSQYNSQGSIQQQPVPPGQPPGSSPGQQRPSRQPSPHQQVSPAPSPVQHRATPNPSPGPPRPTPQPSPGQQRSSQPSPSPSQRSSSSQLSPPGLSPGPGQQNSLSNNTSQHNHQSSPKDSSFEDVKGDNSGINSRPVLSPGSVGSRSNTPASNISGSSPMPPPLQDGAQSNLRMNPAQMSVSGYSQQMMPPPMGPGQMGYSQGNKMGPGGPYYPNSQYPPHSGNYPMRQPGPGYQQNMYNGPSHMQGPSGPMYNNMPGPGMNRSGYMYGAGGAGGGAGGGQSGMMGMNNQYTGPQGPTSQAGPQPINSSNQGPNVNGPPQGNMSSGAGSSGPNVPGTNDQGQGQTPIKGARAAAQAAMAAANAAARNQPGGGGTSVRPNLSQSPQRMYNPNSLGPDPHSMPPQSMSPLSQMGQMNQMGYNSMMNNMPHPQNSLSPVPNAMGFNASQAMPPGRPKMHNSSSVNSYGDQALSKSKTKSKSKSGSSPPIPGGMPNSVQDRPGMPHQQEVYPTHPNVPVDMNNIPNTQPLPSSTPTSSLSEASSHSNDSATMGPVMNNNGCNNSMPDSNVSTSAAHSEAPSSMDMNSSSEGKQITTTANTIPVETATAVTQSITSPVTSISTEAGNSNDSQPMPMETVSQLQNCRTTAMPSPEPPEKKKKTEGSGMPQLPFARVAPSPGGASVASSGTHEDIENIGSPGWPGTPKNTGDSMRLYEMGNEMNRRPFLDRLFAFLEDKGTPITGMPVISKQPLDLFKLYVCVQEKGGMVEVTKTKKWKEICGLVNISGSASAAFTLKKNYIKFLFGFECRFDRNNMDPNPILAQMETDLEKKRNAKNRNRAPSPGSQCSQDGMGGPYMQNDPSMGHMGPGMMGNHMMNSMGPHGPMMGPNNMAGPHHMGPGMQGPGHMMGSSGPPQQMMGGNSGYMMQGAPNNMMGNNMGPQGGMMGPGMQGPNNMMGGPHSGNMMPGNMNPAMMNMNMPPGQMMQPQPSGNMMAGGGMMPNNSINQPIRNSVNQQPPNSGPGHNFPPTSIGRGSGENSVSCQDPFSDEHFSRGNNSQAPQYTGPLQQNGSAAPQSNSPMPQATGGANSQNSAMPSSNTTNSFSSDTPASGGQNSQNASKQETNTSAANQPHLFNQDSNSSNSMSMDSMPSFPAKSDTPLSTQNSNFPLKSDQTPSTQNSGFPGKQESTLSTQNTSLSQPNEVQGNSSQYSNSTTPPTSSSGRQFPFGDQFTKPERFDMSSPGVSQQPGGPVSLSQAQNPNSAHGPMGNQQGPMMTPQSNSMSQAPMNPMMSQGPMMSQQSNPAMTQGPLNTPMSQGQMNPSVSQGPAMSQQGPMMNQQQPNSSQPQGSMNSAMSSQQGFPGPQGPMGQQSTTHGQMMNPQSNTTMSQGHQNPVMSQGVGMNQNPPMSQGQYGQGPMTQPHSMPMNYPQGVNQSPHPNAQQPHMGDGAYPGRYGPQQPGQEHYNSNYSGNQGYGPQGMMNNDQYQGYPNQPGPYGKPPMNRDMSGTIYNTPNKRFPERDQYMTPDRREGPWSPMSHQRGFQNQGQFGPHGMSPSGPPNMSHIQRRMSPDRNRSYTMSPNKMKMGQNMQGPYGKREMHFPMDTVESTQPLLTKRRRLTKHDIGPHGFRYIGNVPSGRRNRGQPVSGQVDAWRIMMSLKSGLLAESTWALDTLNILLYDDSTVAYFGLLHLPGLVEVLLDHFRRCLIEMFDLFDETQIGCGHDDFKQNLIRMAILESADNEDLMNYEERKMKQANKTIGKLEDQCVPETPAETNSESLEKSEPVEKPEGETDVEDKSTSNKENEGIEDMKGRTNYSFITRQGKEVKVEESSDPNGLMDDKYWDVYCEFGDQSELWESGKGDVTEHIQTHFEVGDEIKQYSKRFFRKPMKQEDSSDSLYSKSFNSKSIKCENKVDKDSINAGNPKQECDTKTIDEAVENEKMEFTSDCKDHTCNEFINGVTKSESRDAQLEKNDSTEEVPSDEKFNIADKYFRDGPRMKLAVKYELLEGDELVQKCKNSFGINTEGERMKVEDESYQRNEPPLCLISEAQNEIGARCVCISNIFRSLSCIPGNDAEMSRHPGLIYILGKLLLLHHKHLPRSRVRRKFDRDDVDETMVDTTQGMDEWWWDYLNMLRENTLVIFANVCAQLRLDKFPDDICQPVLDGLVHWVVCPSSCASDPLPTVSPISVLSPLRLVLEAMCKLCIHDKNVDMLLATPPYERIVQLFSVLTKLLANKAEQVTVEFSIVLLSELVKGGSSAARVVALQHPCISLLIDFLETAEQKASQVANMRSIQLLRDNPEMMGTSLDMIRRAATVLLHLAMVPDNRPLFVHQQSRLLSLVMSQILDQAVATILSDVLFQCSS